MTDALLILGVLALVYVAGHVLAWLMPPEAPPLGLTGRALPPGSVLPPTGKDGLHRPSGNLEPRTRGRLIAWSGSVRRAP